MLRYAALEGAVVRRSRSCSELRDLSCRRRHRPFASSAATPTSNAWTRERLVSSSNEITHQTQKKPDLATIFRQRLVEAKKQQDAQGTGALSRNANRLEPQQHSRTNGSPSNLNPRNNGQHQHRNTGKQQYHPRNNHGQQQQLHHRNSNGHQQQHNRMQPQMRPGYNRFQQRQSNNDDPFRTKFSKQLASPPSDVARFGSRVTSPNNKKSSAASIREMLAQTISTAPSPQPKKTSIVEMLKPTSESYFSRHGSNNNKNNNKSTASIRDMLVATASFTPPEKKRDMTDVSNLREAFLKSIEKRKEAMQEERFQRKEQPIVPLSSQQPAWRRDGAQGFRKRIEEQQHAQTEKLEQQKRMREAIHRSRSALFSIKQQEQGKQQKQQKQQVDNLKVTLPPRESTVTELSSLFRVKIDTLMNTLRGLGERPRNEEYLVDLDVMELVAMELGLEPVRSSRRRTKPDDDKNLLLQRRAGAADASVSETTDEAQREAYGSLPPRPPVVCIMGHVDHGKTTLMDALRQKSQGVDTKNVKKSKKGKNTPTADGAVAGTEAGGITQVISAFQVPLENQENAVTFLDTPGHAAFRAMRESGSNAADVIVLVVAADDGVSPQTVEIINFYKSIAKGAGGGGISMVVAMTKIDKHGIDIDESRRRIENQLLEHGILSESFGSAGDSEYGPPVQVIPVSGLTGEGLDDLIEGLVLQSEVMDLRADVNAQAEGIVMDARMEKGVGVVADCIIRWGSLERGNVIVSGVHSGKVKALKDMNGATTKKGSPSQPVRIFGFKSLPRAGDPIVCVASEEVADQIIERRQALQQAAAQSSTRTSVTDDAEMQVTGAASKRGSSLEAVLTKYGQDNKVNGAHIRIPIIIKADGEGSLAALRESMLGVGDASSFDLVIDPVGAGIGPISASDVRMAKESGASIFSFGVKQNDKAVLSLAETEGVEIRSHNVIYSLLDEAKGVFATHLPPVPVEVVHGKAKVQAIFDVNNKKDAERIAGLSVLDGTLYKEKAQDSKGARIDCHYRVLRKGTRVSPEGETLKVSSLRKVKEDVDDVRRGEECGLGLSDYADFEKGDIIECYSIEMKREFV